MVSIAVGALGDRDAPAADDVAEDVLAIDLAADSRSSWLLRNWRSISGRCGESETALQMAAESRP